ncbi:rCG58449, isoform CRA_b [Rattus norvegicus]|uniref:RCG58449, isoform CRA_b n=1 Tax=Rattus norvegicus TaxID=10116 RepID=A6J418_RAT|nr:rCG58449, isoform CRA_b [Rattus norvegicus]
MAKFIRNLADKAPSMVAGSCAEWFGGH